MQKQFAGQVETIFISSDVAERKINFNESWKFYIGTSNMAQNISFDDSGWWNAVTLPHDFSIFQPFTTTGEAESGFLPGGTGWYRKSFKLSKNFEGKTLLLNFDGIYNEAYVYVNGIYMGEHHYGYTPFAFDITNNVICDGKKENVIAIKVVNALPSSRWYSGSGIYRNVTLIVTDPVHVDRYGTFVTTPDIAFGKGTVQVETEVVNDQVSDVDVIVKQTVFTKAEECVSGTSSKTVTIGSKNKLTVTQSTVVPEPKLWSVDEPNMYFVRTELVVNDEVVDTYDTPFGFRYISFNGSTGFSLNGKNLKLNGVCLHHDQGALGAAAYYDAMYRQLSIMKDMGANAIRTSHNPVDSRFIEICNEIGLLVIEEAFDGWSSPKNGNINDFARYFNTFIDSTNSLIGASSSMTWAEFVLKSMIKRDRNAPCIILWSLGNEIQEGATAEREFPTIAQNLINWTKELDTTRLTTIGDNTKSMGPNSVLGRVLDVIRKNGGVVGFNYAESSQFSELYTIYGSVMASETASAVNSRGIYMSQANSANVDEKYHLTSYDTSTVGWGKTAHESIWDTLTVDYVAGEFVWTGFDYIGEPTPWNGTGVGSVSGAGPIPNSSYFGIVDTTGFEKDVYYLYRSQWNHKSTTLHLVTAWDSNNMYTVNRRTPVVIYSNAPKVELYRNDVLVGTATRTTSITAAGHKYYTYSVVSNHRQACMAKVGVGAESLYCNFFVEYIPGTIYAKAYDEFGNEITDFKGTASITTPYEASKLRVSVDKTEIDADRHSLVYISVEVTDEYGNIDTTATNQIYFDLTGYGKILGVDNGDQATIHKYQQQSVLTGRKSANITAYAGKALVIVRSTREVGSFTVDVSSYDLEGDSVTIYTNPVDEDKVIKDGVTSYTMVRDYTIQAGVIPRLETTATGTIAMHNGQERIARGMIKWDAIPENIYNTPGDYIIDGLLTFPGRESIAVICRLHVIADVVALRNISTVTTPRTIPTLPDKVDGIMADGTLCGEFDVTWQNVSREMFARIGSIVEVEGTANIIGELVLPVKLMVRVAEASNAQSANVANAAFISQDIPANRQTDNLGAIINGIQKKGTNPKERWSNWNNRRYSDKATLTFTWATAQLISHMNVFYFFDSHASTPEEVTFEYSLNGQEYAPIGAKAKLLETFETGAKYTYTFHNVINPIAIRMTVKQKGGISGDYCVAITETEIMTYAARLDFNASATLSHIVVDGMPIANFTEHVFNYEENGESVSVESKYNAGITILPKYEGKTRILTISEDGKEEFVYVIG